MSETNTPDCTSPSISSASIRGRAVTGNQDPTVQEMWSYLDMLVKTGRGEEPAARHSTAFIGKQETLKHVDGAALAGRSTSDLERAFRDNHDNLKRAVRMARLRCGREISGNGVQSLMEDLRQILHDQGAALDSLDGGSARVIPSSSKGPCKHPLQS